MTGNDVLSGWDNELPVRELMVKVIERWFPDDDAPYNRVDELLDPARNVGYRFGVTEEMIEYWSDAKTELDRLGHTVQDLGRQFMSNACIHEDHGGCEEECSYCDDGCACACHPWNEERLKPAQLELSEGQKRTITEAVVAMKDGVPPGDDVAKLQAGIAEGYRYQPPICSTCGHAQELVRRFNGGKPMIHYESACSCDEQRAVSLGSIVEDVAPRARMKGGTEPSCPACFGDGEITTKCELCEGSGVYDVLPGT